MNMLAFHAWFVPLVVLVVLRLLRQKLFRDTAVFLFVTLAGYGLWICIVNHRPFIVTTFIAGIIETVKDIASLVIINMQ